MSRRRALETFVAGYFDEITSFSFDELVEEQPAPYRSLACGAAGLAWVLWRASRAPGGTPDAPAFEVAANRWVDDAAARSDDPDTPGAPPLEGSVYFGPAGVDLMAGVLGRSDAIDRFAARGRAAMRDGLAELYFGTAGFLVGATILAAAGSEVAADLEAELLEHLLGVELDEPSMAHGQAGVLFAALGAVARRGESAPGRLADRLEALDERDGEGRFCAGPAGRTVLWARAAALTEEPRHLARARSAAAATYRQPHPYPDFCCGLVGSAYALLAMSPLDPGPWRERAEELAIAALASEIETEWVHGLFKGESGLACLAIDLVGDTFALPALGPA